METSYQVAEGTVNVTVIIGNAQIGVSSVVLGDEIIATGDITEEDVGKGPELIGQQLVVKTVVADVNDSTNRTNVKYLLKGGKMEQEFNLYAIVDEDGDSVIYWARFNFTS